jgi:hypothetical protein
VHAPRSGIHLQRTQAELHVLARGHPGKQRVLAYSAEPGHPLRRKLGTCSNANWTRVPGQTGHYGRSDAGSMFGFYSWSVCAVKRARIFRMESPFNVS